MCSWGPRPSLHRPPGLAGAPALTCPPDCSVISLCSATSRLGTSHPVPRPWSGSQCPPCRCQSCPCLCPRLVPTSTLSGAAESSRPTCVPAQPEAPAPGTRRPSGDAHLPAPRRVLAALRKVEVLALAPGPGRLVCFAPLPAPPLQELRARRPRPPSGSLLAQLALASRLPLCSGQCLAHLVRGWEDGPLCPSRELSTAPQATSVSADPGRV